MLYIVGAAAPGFAGPTSKVAAPRAGPVAMGATDSAAWKAAEALGMPVFLGGMARACSQALSRDEC